MSVSWANSPVAVGEEDRSTSRGGQMMKTVQVGLVVVVVAHEPKPHGERQAVAVACTECDFVRSLSLSCFL